MTAQAVRRAKMRERLIEATLDSLMEIGYHRTSTTEIVRRAGVSRGALVHHFACKADLIAAASEKMLDDANREIEDLAARLAKTDITLNDFMHHLWDKFSGRLFYITLEYVTAARTDEELRLKLAPVVARFHGALDTIWRRFFKKSRLTRTQVDMILNMTLCLLRGMGVQTVLRRDPDYYEGMLTAWKELLVRIVQVQDSAGPDRVGKKNKPV
jgi:AcrR family transcriptional regulator